MSVGRGESVTTERGEVEAAVTEYFESWFDGDGDRMGRILHPDLCKRRVGDRLAFTTREQMIEWTAAGEGVREGVDRSLDVVVLDVHGDIASVRVRSAVYYEYLHLVRTDDGWKIANALFEQLDGN
jgi:ketosteroid isomerase-like protein